jgi:hypothetical protein
MQINTDVAGTVLAILGPCCVFVWWVISKLLTYNKKEVTNQLLIDGMAKAIEEIKKDSKSSYERLEIKIEKVNEHLIKLDDWVNNPNH